MISSPSALSRVVCSRRTATALALAFATAAALPANAVTDAPRLPPGGLPFGVYDPPGDFSDVAGVTIEHVFLPWEDVVLETLFDAADYAAERGRVLLVTLEPWTWVRAERNTPEILLAGIAGGTFDANVLSVCGVLDQLAVPVTFRWGHEMEAFKGQFIWSGWEPELYIDAFRRVVSLCRSVAPEVAMMWSPLGNEGMEAYWPGDDYVDIVGLSVFGYQPADQLWEGRDMTFAEILAPRYQRAEVFGKPIVVAELGFSGSAEYVETWMNDVCQIWPEFPNLVGVVYFNFPEVYAWPDDLGVPDWRFGFRIID